MVGCGGSNATIRFAGPGRLNPLYEPLLTLRLHPHRTKHVLKRAPQRHVHLGHADDVAEIEKACHAEAGVADTAWHDAAEVGEVRIDVEADAVQADPALYADADGGDLVLAIRALFGTTHP